MPSTSYLSRAASPLKTPQSEPIPGSSQVENRAGGFAWEISSMDRLRRFLILGSEGGTYYATERNLTRQNIDGVKLALDENGVAAVQEIINISTDGRAPKNDPALYALAIACAHSDENVRKAALYAIPRVARTGTHLFHFAEFVQTQRGWGRALKSGIASWYEQDEDKLAYQVVKYRQRDGWTHRDLLRLAHPEAISPTHASIFNWLCNRDNDSVLPITIKAFKYAQASDSFHETANLIKKYGNKLPREALNTEHLNSGEVWEALLYEGMPLTAMIRNLATMTRIEVLKPMSKGTSYVIEKLSDQEYIHKSKVHPLSILGALATYSSGHSARGISSWTPLREIIDSLNKAFYISFKNIKPTNKRTLLALDVSGSMTFGDIGGMPGIDPRIGSAAMALVTASTEPNYHIVGFSHELIPLSISPNERLDDVISNISGLPFGRTDCAQPMIYALNNKLEIDTFCIYTDNETYFGNIHPMQALYEYRRISGINSKLVIIGMTADKFSIADPNDSGSLDVIGFDTATPQVIADFSADRF